MLATRPKRRQDEPTVIGTDRIQPASPELQFLLACFRAGSDPAAAPLPPGDPSPAARIVELASAHGLGPLLSARLAAGPPSALAAEVQRRLAPVVSRRLRVALQLSAELLAVLDLLRSHGIPAVPYKGPVLAVELYGSPGLRAYRDLDVLIHPEHLARARELLAGRDYRPFFELAPRFEAAHLATGYHFNLARDRDAMLLELHWRVADPYFSTLGEEGLLWEELREVPFLGRTVSSLAPEALLLCLAIHGAKHHWDQLAQVVDFAALVQAHPQLDPDRLVSAARQSGSLRRLQVAFHLAGLLLGAPPPAGWPLPTDARSERLAAEFAARLTAGHVSPPGLLAHARVDLAGMDRASDRARYLRGILAPNVSDWANSPLPPSLGALLPLLRPFRLLRRYGLLRRSGPEE